MTTETSIYEFAKRGFRQFPDKTALWFYGRSVSFRELFGRIDQTANRLVSSGVGRGSVVTIHLPNCPQAVVVFYAAAKLGAICNMVHAQTPVHGVKEMMAFAESKFLFSHLQECTEIPVKTVVVNVAKKAYETVVTNEWVGLDLDAKCTWDESVTDPAAEQTSLAKECVVYLHSSGSTGKPKTIMLSHSALNHCVRNTEDFFEDDPSEYVCLGVLPMFHGFGLAMDVHRNLAFGSTLVQMLRWDTQLAIQLIKEQKISLMAGVPAMYYALLHNPEFFGEEISHLKKCYVGGDNVKPQLIREFDARIDGEHHMFVGYGLTEATTTDFVNTYLHYKEGSCGYPTRGTTAAVMDESGTISERGEGELVISSETLMLGYLKDDEATSKTILFSDGKRWTRTGDFVNIDEDGFVFFKDRIKNIISHNGYNIYPAQIEEIIRTVTQVKDVCVVGVDVPLMGTQNVRAVIIPKTEDKLDELKTDVIKKCMEILPRYSVPKEIIFLSEFPHNAIGKIDRVKLGEIHGQKDDT